MRLFIKMRATAVVRLSVLLGMFAVSNQVPLNLTTLEGTAGETQGVKGDVLSGPAREIQMDIYDKRAELMSNQDAQGISELFTEDCKLLYNYLDVLIGRENAEKVHQALFDEAGVIAVNFFITEVGPVGSSYTFVWGAYEAYVKPDIVAEYGKFFSIVRRVNGTWLIYVDSSSPSPYRYNSCTDKSGNTHEHEESWNPDLCSRCTCDNGAIACFVYDCAWPQYPEPICNVTDTNECCPTFECKSGCVTDGNVFYEPGATWNLDKCTECVCPQGEGFLGHLCSKPFCKSPTSDDCIEIEVVGECCPKYECPEPAYGPCSPNPCMNDGTCTRRYIFFYKCSCPEGYEGKQCEFIVEPETKNIDDSTGCIDDSGKSYPLNSNFERNCQQCTCTPSGEIFCTDKSCPLPRDNLPPNCQYVTPPGGCCSTRMACIESLSNCPADQPVASCASNECLTATCERYPDAMCSLSLCGPKACQASFYDENRNKELDCSGTEESAIILSDLSEQHTTGPTIPPPVSCIPITCANTCESASRRVVDGCPTCECLNRPTMTTVKPTDLTEASTVGPTIPPIKAPTVCELNGVEYKIGETFNDGCNDCTCSEIGEMACTLKLCESASPTPLVETAAAGPCSPNPCMNDGTCTPRYTYFYKCACPEGYEGTQCELIVCEMNKVKYRVGEIQNDGCNNCTCSESGEMLCTNELCDSDCEMNGVKYKVGDIYNDGCNDCTCLESGEMPCTLKLCELVCEMNGVEYKVGDTFNDGCNDCTCSENGQMACTLKLCESAPTVCELNGVEYKIGETFNDGCNDCTCLEIGEMVCTLKLCESASATSLLETVCEMNEVKYRVGEIHNDGCNNCTCSESGEMLCTNELCDSDCEMNGVKYKVGDIYNDGCNDCTCLESGEMPCTLKLCELEVAEKKSRSTDPLELEAGCVDKNGNPKASGDSWVEPCGECTCVDGFSACPIPSCTGPPHPLCTMIEDENSCCPSFDCPMGCVDEFMVIHESGDIWRPNACTKCICPFGEGLRPVTLCKTKACPSPPSSLCAIVEPAEGECCPTFSCTEETTIRLLSEVADETNPEMTKEPTPMVAEDTVEPVLEVSVETSPETTIEPLHNGADETSLENIAEPVPEITVETSAETTVRPLSEVADETSPENNIEPVPEETVKTSPETTKEPTPMVAEDTVEPVLEVSVETSPETTIEPLHNVADETSPENIAEPVPEFTVETSTEMNTELHTIADETNLEDTAYPVFEVSAETSPETTLEPVPEVPDEISPEDTVEPVLEVSVETSPETTELVTEIPVESSPEDIVDPVPEVPAETSPEDTTEPISQIPDEATPEDTTEPIPQIPDEATPEGTTDPVPEIPDKNRAEDTVELVPDIPDKTTPGDTIQPVSQAPDKMNTEDTSEPVPEIPYETTPEDIIEPVSQVPDKTNTEDMIEPVFEISDETTPEYTVEPVAVVSDKTKSEITIDSLPVIPDETTPEDVTEPVPEILDETTAENTIEPFPKVTDETSTENTIEPLPEVTDETSTGETRQPVSKTPDESSPVTMMPEPEDPDDISSANEEPFMNHDLEDAWVVRYGQDVTLTCGAELDPLLISFECNGQLMATSRVTYATSDNITYMASIDISRQEVEDHTGDKFWCECWASTKDFTIKRSSRAYVGIKPDEEPFKNHDLEDAWVVRYSQDVTLTCGAELDPQLISFECNGQLMATSRVTYTTFDKFTYTASIDISRREVEDHTGDKKFWCECWASTKDFTIRRSSRAYVGISYFRKFFQQEPASVDVKVGDNVLLLCKPPTARPDPIITWEKDGDVVNTETGSRFSVTMEGSLIIDSAEVGDVGDYVCVAENPAKKRRSSAATVMVSA